MRPDERSGSPSLTWRPKTEEIARSNLGRFTREVGLSSYGELHRWSVDRRADFWGRAIGQLGVVFQRAPETILEPEADVRRARWLRGARLNATDSCFKAMADRPAVVSAGEASPRLATTTYGQLKRMSGRVANALRARGLGAGDAVALYMPMTLDCVAAYLGVVRAGCRVVSIADSFPAPELRRRLEIGRARLIVTVDRYERAGKTISLYETVREAEAATAVVVSNDTPVEWLRAEDLSWESFVDTPYEFETVGCDPYDVTNVLFSSGTTGDPKAIPWTHLTPIKCAVDGHFHQDIRPGDVVAWPTNIGWMMGPWLIYAALINDATIALYEGAPTGEGFARFVQDAGVTMLGLVPSLVRAWRESGATDGADWSRVRLFSSTGEPSGAADYEWLMGRAGFRAPVIEYCGGTEIGGGYITGSVLQPAAPATFTTPALGIDFVLLDEEGREVDEGEAGEVFLIPPSIGLSDTLLNADHEAVYYRGAPTGPHGETLRRHGDRMVRLPGGFWRAEGRADDTMNLGGIKVSSIEIERVVDRHDEVVESAAISVAAEGGERLVVFVVPVGAIDEERLRVELGARIAAELNPLFKIRDLVRVEALPRTASNKLMRRELRSRYGEEGRS